MQKEQVSDKQGICLIIVFIIGSSLIVGIGQSVTNDAWLAGIAGILMSVPMLLIYARILSLFKENDLFTILDIVLGKFFGRIIALIYVIYAFHLGALVLRNFGEFINVVAMPETPMFVPVLCLGLVCVYAAKLGIEVLGRMTTYFLPLLIVILIAVQLLAIPQLNINYLKPVFGSGLPKILRGGFSVFAFPLAETVLFLGAFGSLKTKKSPYRIYFIGLLIASIILIITTIRNIGVLGNMLDSYYFPSYAAVSRIKIGDFLQRIEVTVSIVFIFGVLIKSAVCLTVACKGVSKIFRLSNYRSIVIQTGLLMIGFSYILYNNIMDMKTWAFKVYPYYTFPMEVILPVVIWIFAEIKSRKKPAQVIHEESS